MRKGHMGLDWRHKGRAAGIGPLGRRALEGAAAGLGAALAIGTKVSPRRCMIR